MEFVIHLKFVENPLIFDTLHVGFAYKASITFANIHTGFTCPDAANLMTKPQDITALPDLSFCPQLP